MSKSHLQRVFKKQEGKQFEVGVAIYNVNKREDALDMPKRRGNAKKRHHSQQNLISHHVGGRHESHLHSFDHRAERK